MMPSGLPARHQTSATSHYRILWAVLALGLATSSALPAQLTTLHSFCAEAGCPDGQNVYAGLVQGFDGQMYGTTFQGGVSGGGTVFEISSRGKLTTLYSFCAMSACADGQLIYAGLTLARDGNFYGVAQAGGANGYGTVFSITPAGTLTTIHSFCSRAACADGGYPYAGLIQGSTGTFYGTTYIGGGSNSQGTVFQITSSGSLTGLYNFCQAFECPDGSSAIGGVIMGSDGNLYGTTYAGAGAGWQQGLGNAGTIFQAMPSGGATTLYSFCPSSACPGGYGPRAPLVQGRDGNFYGTTFQSGAPDGDYGTVFQFTPSGSLTTLYSFCAVIGCPDGANPDAPLIQATDGNFYGTTQFGGAYDGGTVFQITPEGTLTTLYSFCAEPACADGQAPYAGLFQGTDGNLYGTTYQGGNAGMGTVFQLSVGIGPFVEMVPASAPVKSTVQILGTNLTGATKVSFNGTPAEFTVVSASQITATVPRGATTGVVRVTATYGTLSSNVAFQIPPG